MSNLIERTEKRIKELKRLALDPYSGGTELEDAKLLEELLERLTRNERKIYNIERLVDSLNIHNDEGLP